MQFVCAAPVVVWAALFLVMGFRRAVGWAFGWPSPRPGHGVNWFYAAVIVLTIVVPLVSHAYSEGRPRGSRPHGQFMIGLFVAALVLFAVGQFRAHAYDRRNGYWVPAIFVALALAIGWLLLINFGSNFSV